MDLGRVELVRFLALRPPFDRLSEEELSELVVGIELEFHPSGSAILTEDGGLVTFLRVIHAGAVSILHDGQLLDRLSRGDLFGQDAMMAGLAPGFEARASEDTLCYRIPAASARPLLERARRRELTRRSREPGQEPVASLVRGAPLICGPGEPIAAVAGAMTQAGVDAALVQLGSQAATAPEEVALASHLGLVTDCDLRSRVIAAGLSVDAPVSAIMTTPVFCVGAERLGAEVMFELLERGIHHAPVLSAAGRVLGVITESDLFGAREGSWFGVRRQISGARDEDALAGAARLVDTVLAELHGARMGPLEMARVLTALTDALVIRALELAGPGAGFASTPGVRGGLTWVSLASQARRELTPASSPDGALICDGPVRPDWETSVARLFRAGGLPGAVAAASSRAWRDAELGDARAVMVLSDRRPLYGIGPAADLPAAVGPRREQLLEHLAQASREAAVPTGFAQGSVLGGDGARSERIDIHAAAVAPIEALARWSGAAAGVSEGSTPERLSAGAAAGLYTEADARALTDAFTAAFELRMAHQLEQIAAGRRPDDSLVGAELDAETQGRLREVFHTIGAVGRRLG